LVDSPAVAAGAGGAPVAVGEVDGAEAGVDLVAEGRRVAGESLQHAAVTRLSKRFDSAARARVEAAVRTAEARSKGQIVPIVVAQSSTYADVRLRAALLGLGIGTAAVVLAVPQAGVAWVVAAQGAAMALGYALSAIPVLLRALAGRAALAHAARDRAMRAFLEHGLAHTSERTGVLVFASMLEQQGVVLGDEAIHAKMKDGEWDRALTALTAELARGAPDEGFCRAIAIVGDKLAEHFPAQGRATNELPNPLEVDET
jgi:putative membrane protein